MTDILDDIFEDIINKKNSIFINKDILHEKYVPTLISHRDYEIKKLGEILAPVLKNESSQNIRITGDFGTGKTLCVKYVLKKLQEKNIEINNKKLKIVIINCRLNGVSDSPYRLLLEILKQLGIEMCSTGIATSFLYEELESISLNENIILLFDEFDFFLQKEFSNELLYNLTTENKQIFTIIGIGQKPSPIIFNEIINFKSYNLNQIQNILTERASLALKKDIISKDTIKEIANYNLINNGNIKLSIKCLKDICEYVESKNLIKIELSTVKYFFKNK